MQDTAAAAPRYAEPPHRSALFVPGIQPRMLEKATGSDADAVWIDLEDAVPPDEKDAARALVAERLPAFGAKPTYVRVNALPSGQTMDDLDAVVQPALQGIVLPKASSAADVHVADHLLFVAERRAGSEVGAISLIVTIEGVDGAAACREILRASPRVTGVLVGIAQDGDTQRELGYRWTPEGLETLYLRSRVLLEGRAARLSHLFEGPYVRHQDDEGLRRDAAFGRQLGYTGKAAIHPRQVGVINEVFSPTEEELRYYRELVAAMEEAYERGLAAITFEGKLVDTAMLEHARQVLEGAR